jgi:hypothetical protein
MKILRIIYFRKLISTLTMVPPLRPLFSCITLVDMKIIEPTTLDLLTARAFAGVLQSCGSKSLLLLGLTGGCRVS